MEGKAGRGEGIEVAVSRKKMSTTVYITPEQNDRLKLLNEKTKVPVAEYIRQGIELVLAKYEHHLPGQRTWFGVPQVLPAPLATEDDM